LNVRLGLKGGLDGVLLGIQVDPSIILIR
jgi:hypothetical protein